MARLSPRKAKHREPSGAFASFALATSDLLQPLAVSLHLYRVSGHGGLPSLLICLSLYVRALGEVGAIIDWNQSSAIAGNEADYLIWGGHSSSWRQACSQQLCWPGFSPFSC
jgi:hypothetical protein